MSSRMTDDDLKEYQQANSTITSHSGFIGLMVGESEQLIEARKAKARLEAKYGDSLSLPHPNSRKVFSSLEEKLIVERLKALEQGCDSE